MRMKIVLGLVSAFFLGLLVVTYVVARRANPVMLDEHGRVVGSAAPSAGRTHE
jgi:hypothetical protein